jgi:PQQ-like domain
MVRSLIIFTIAISLFTACTEKKKTKKIEVENPSYPAISWKKGLNSKVFVFGESNRRIFAFEYDENNKPISMNSYDKRTGRSKWRKDIEVALRDPSIPWSYGAGIKGVTIAVWTKENKIVSVDKYQGRDHWDKPVDGMGLSVIGENFITAYKTNIRLIDPETGKVSDIDVGSEITKPIHVTSKGYLVVVTGETGLLVDIENLKLNVLWKWEMNLDGGFYPGSVFSAGDVVAFLQRTRAVERKVTFFSYDTTTLKQKYKLLFRGTESRPNAFQLFENGNHGRLVINPESKGDKKWYTVDLKSGKIVGKPLVNSDNQPKDCVLTEKLSFCATEKGVSLYDTSLWTKKWFQETIYPVNDAEHKFAGDNIVLAAGTRVKVFSSKGANWVFEIKDRNLKEPRVNRILGSSEGVIYFTVVDYTRDNRGKNKGEIWALDINTKKRKWKVSVGEAKNTLDAIVYLPKQNLIYAVDNSKISKIELPAGQITKRFHRVKTNKKSRVKLGINGKIGYAIFENEVKLFAISQKKFKVFKNSITLVKKPKKRKLKKGEKPEEPKKFAFMGAYSNIKTDTHLVILKAKQGNKEIVCYNLDTGGKLWTKEIKSIFDPTFNSLPSGFFFSTREKSYVVDPKSGKTIKELPGTHRYFIVGNSIVLMNKVKNNPSPSTRLMVFDIKPVKGKNPKTVWQKVFKKEKETLLEGMIKATPSWLATSTDYIYYPTKGGRCVKMVDALNGENIMEFCKGAWPWPPLFYDKKFYQATGMKQESIPSGQQGLISFSLDKKWKQVIKIGKYGDNKYLNTQFSPIKRGTLYLLGNGETLQAIRVAE